ncbi:LysR family transcriptional regulator [Ligilactobacillus sp. Marseille-Q7487]|jgi:DNA-binding transcriptional LysR family regulator|uniref:LysR family transcriptional regulator n=1 Tax=Ligilactobacillus sp. Marseille-Q7487 TaxID=3022128 RepID=UPI0015B465D9|nr:LysR family transcriptional regulator [Ligilactobacillus sp. Marseille-Q7487]
MISLLKLKYFVDVIETGSFTKAGKKNHIAQTSVTQQVREIEKYFQCTLINRNVLPVRPTKIGESLYLEAKKLLLQYELLEKQMQEKLNQQGPLKIAYTSVIDMQLLNKLLTGKNSAEPLMLQKVKLENAARGLLQRDYDFVITFDSEFYDEEKITTYELAAGKYVIGVSIDHPLATKKEVTLKDVYKYPLIMLNKETIGKSYDIMLERSQKIGIKPQIVQTADDVESEIFMIEHQNLVGFFPENYPLSSDKKSLIFVPVVDTPHVYKIVLAYLREELSSKQQAFLQHIHQI